MKSQGYPHTLLLNPKDYWEDPTYSQFNRVWMPSLTQKLEWIQEDKNRTQIEQFTSSNNAEFNLDILPKWGTRACVYVSGDWVLKISFGDKAFAELVSETESGKLPNFKAVFPDVKSFTFLRDANVQFYLIERVIVKGELSYELSNKLESAQLGKGEFGPSYNKAREELELFVKRKRASGADRFRVDSNNIGLVKNKNSDGISYNLAWYDPLFEPDVKVQAY